MVAIISPPVSFPVSIDVSQKKLGATDKKTTVLVAGTAANIIDADITASLGRKIFAINNTSSSDSVLIAMGRVATVNDFDFKLAANSQIIDWDWNDELVSAICTGSATIITNIAKILEV